MKWQDKKAEMDVGSVVPGDNWLDNVRTYRVKRKHLELLQITSLQDRLILDVGCGPGTYGLILAEEGNSVIGIDISPEVVSKARDRAQQKGLRFWPQVGDIEKLPHGDNIFDVCFCGWVLHHLPDLDSSVGELYRVLKPGGLIALVEPNESDIAVKFSRFVEDLPLIRRWVLDIGWDTPNRAKHMPDDYETSLKKQGFLNIEISSCFTGALPPLSGRPRKGLTNFLLKPFLLAIFRLRQLIFVLSAKIVPRPLNGADLLIIATKKDWNSS